MWVLALFTDGGAPYTGLSPTLNGYDVSDDSVDINAQAMAEIAGGWYKYNFSGADETKGYAFTGDGGVALPNSKRYAYGSWNGISGEIKAAVITNAAGADVATDIIALKAVADILLKIGRKRWKIDVPNNQLIYYDNDNTTPLYTFNLLNADGAGVSINPMERVPV